MNFDVEAWIKDCQDCCRGKVTSQPVLFIRLPFLCTGTVMYIYLPVAAYGSAYILTMIDRSTRCLEATPLALWRQLPVLMHFSTAGLQDMEFHLLLPQTEEDN